MLKKILYITILGILAPVLVMATTIKVQYGDTLSQIAKKHNTTVETLAFYNNIDNPDLIYAGDEIDIVGPQELDNYYDSISFGGLIGGNPIPTDNYDTYLTAAISSSATTVYVNALPTGITDAIYTIFASDGITVSEKMYCTGTATSPSNNLTGCVRGVSASPSGGVITENAGTGTAHSKNARIAITDNINYTGKALTILNGTQKTSSTEFIFGDGSTTTKKKFYFCDSSSTSTCGYIYATASTTQSGSQELGYSPDGTTEYSFDAGSSGLLPGTGLTVSNSIIGLNFTATSSGFGIDNTGQLVLTTTTNNGIYTNADGLAINTSTSFVWTGGHTFGDTTSTNSTSTNFGATTVSTTNLMLYGQNANSLVDGSDASALHTHSAYATMVSSTSQTTSITSAADTPVLTQSISANTLQDDECIVVKAFISDFDVADNSNGGNIRLKYGSTTVASAALYTGGTVSNAAMYIEGMVCADGSTGKQFGTLRLSLDVNTAGGIGSYSTASSEMKGALAFGTATEDASGALNIILSHDWDNTTGSPQATYKYAYIYKITN